MKSVYLLTIAMVFNTIGYAQDWQPFPYDLKKWFEFNNDTHYSISSYYPDSLQMEGDSTHHYFHLKYVEDYLKSFNTTGMSCLNESVEAGSEETWLDRFESRTQDFVSIKYPITEKDGQYFYKGQLVFDTNLRIGEGLRLYSDLYEGISELRPTYVQRGVMDVFGQPDSFKVYQLRPVLNNPLVPHPYSDYQYVLSKSYGFIEFLPFMELFETPKTRVTLAGYEDEDGNLIGDVPTFRPNYEVGDIIEYKREFDDFSNSIEIEVKRDSITSVEINDTIVNYTYDSRVIKGDVNTIQPPPGVYYPENPLDTTYFPNQEQQFFLVNPNPFADFYNSIYNSNTTINLSAQPLNFSFTESERSVNITSGNLLTITYIPSVDNCFSTPVPFLSSQTNIYNSQLGFISDQFFGEAGFETSNYLITHTKANKAYTPFASLNAFYDITDTLILLKNEYHPFFDGNYRGLAFEVNFEGPGVDGHFFNPSLVPDSLINLPFEITSTCSFWSATQTVLVRTPDFCPCEDEEPQPICGENGVNYDNACLARCDGTDVAFEGSCDLATCDTPLQLEFVQNAINEGCAELIHTATDNGRKYISINKNCNGEGMIYDCTNGTVCTYTDRESLDECETDVPLDFDLLLGFYFDLDNVIWSKPCNYEYEGIVEYDWFACGPACDGIIYYVILNDGSRVYPFQQNLIQEYEGRYVRFSFTETANLTLGIGYGNTVPSQHITCLEPVNVEPCACNRWYEPVCGVDGQTYLNDCVAECAGIEIEKEEACENQTCDNALDLEIVQNAINEGCAEVIFQSLVYGMPYITIDKNCDGDAVIYNCNTGDVCTYDYESFAGDCDTTDTSLAIFRFDLENIIWTKPCNYEYEGYVRNEFYDCGPGCSGIRYFITLNDGSRIYPLQWMQDYWGSYIRFSRTETTNIINETEEGNPLPIYHITCFESLNDESCSCDLDYIPVCGIDGKTYLNDCIAECIGVEVATEGECESATCENPLELQVVQDAINDGCAELIYSFTHEGTDYININIDCEGNGIIYNCSENTVCTYNDDEDFLSNGSLVSNCGLTVDAIIDNPPTEDNIIWSKGCNLETTGRIEYRNWYCGSACTGLYLYLLLEDGTEIYPSDALALAYHWEIGYQEMSITYAQTPNLFFIDSNESPVFPLSYIICTEPLDECYPCIEEPYEPVCGNDGNTYDNECFAQCNGVQVDREGACESATCENPLELQIVQYAINNGCTELIYSFTYEGTDYININIDCEGNGIIYNCNENTVCTYNDEDDFLSNGSLISNCNLMVDAIIDNPPTEDNIIWSKGCNLEIKGTIRLFEFACGTACDATYIYLELEDGTEIFPSNNYYPLSLYWEYGYQEVSFNYAQTPNLFFIDYGGRPLVPLSYIICIESFDGCYPCDNEPYEPVCGKDDNTYDNECFAQCNGVQVEREGKCESPAPSIGIFNCD